MNFMNVSQDKYGIGQPVSRSEDPLLLKVKEFSPMTFHYRVSFTPT